MYATVCGSEMYLRYLVAYMCTPAEILSKLVKELQSAVIPPGGERLKVHVFSVFIKPNKPTG